MTSNITNPRTFFDVEIDGKKIGRIVFQVYADVVPRTAENFRALCTGEKGLSKISGLRLHYKGCPFHRIIKNFMIQGGDFQHKNGTGGESIYGIKFNDENFTHKHTTSGMLSMANAGPNTNRSQFFITTGPAPHLDGKHVVFGRVVNGMDVLEILNNILTDANDTPFAKAIIANCGELVLQIPKGMEALLAKTKEASSSSSSSSESSSSESEPSSEEDERKKRRKERRNKKKEEKAKAKEEKSKKKEEKKAKKLAKQKEKADKEDKQAELKRKKIAEVEHSFLWRRSRSPQNRSKPTDTHDNRDKERDKSRSPRRDRSRSPPRSSIRYRNGVRVKGRGTMMYRSGGVVDANKNRRRSPPPRRDERTSRRSRSRDRKNSKSKSPQRWEHDHHDSRSDGSRSPRKSGSRSPRSRRSRSPRSRRSRSRSPRRFRDNNYNNNNNNNNNNNKNHDNNDRDSYNPQKGGDKNVKENEEQVRKLLNMSDDESPGKR